MRLNSFLVKKSALVEVLENYLEGQPEWVISDKHYITKKKDYNGVSFEYFSSGACISFKTRDGLTYKANYTREKKELLEPWGNVKNLKRAYLWI